MPRGLPRQAGDRGHVDDAAAPARDHAGLADRLRQQEEAAHVEVHHLVPGLERMVLGRRAPGGAGVVDEDVDVAERSRSPRRPGAATSAGWLAVGGDPVARRCRAACRSAAASSRSAALRDAEHDARAGLAERLGDLQAQAARAAGDERGAARQVEQRLDAAAFGEGVVGMAESVIVSRSCVVRTRLRARRGRCGRALRRRAARRRSWAARSA